MKKRIVALVLALSLAMGLTGGMVFAADEETGGSCGDSVYWEFDESTGTLTIYGTGEMDYAGDYTVDDDGTVIDSGVDGSEYPWYPYSSDIKSVVIEPGVTAIAIGAFMNYYTSIESVSIPSTVTSIGTCAFSGCTSLVSIEISEGVISIGIGAFAGCTSLESVSLPSTLETIYNSAFYGCTSLVSIEIPEGIQAIESYTFLQCSSLESISIPSTVTSIGQSVFAGCISLTDVYYAGTEEQWNEVSIDADNTYLLNAAVHYNSTGTDDSDSSSGSDISDDSDSADTGSTDIDSTDDSTLSDDSDASSGISADATDSEPSASDTSLNIIASETTASYTLGSGGSAVIAVDADIETFVSVAVDGTVLTLDTDYTVTEGSTIITFTESFLETLSEGDHDVVIAFEDGDVETTLSVEASDSSSGSEDADNADDSDDSSAAEVGDASNLALWMALGLLAALGLAGSGLRRRTAR